jgi:hypothetical protein
MLCLTYFKKGIQINTNLFAIKYTILNFLFQVIVNYYMNQICLIKSLTNRADLLLLFFTLLIIEKMKLNKKCKTYYYYCLLHLMSYLMCLLIVFFSIFYACL